MIHPAAWLTWVLAIVVVLSMTRNPVYLGLVLLWIALVAKLMTPLADAPPVPLSVRRFALIVLTTSSLFNLLTIHFGSTILFHLPDMVPLIGGRITLEALVYGFLNGLVLTGLYAAFTVLNQHLPVRALVRLIPQAFYPIAVVASIAITFVPVTLRQFQQIRQAQAIRGHRVRGVRDWLPLLIPLLIGGLEHALQLAEAMTARGFASQDQASHDRRVQLALIAGLGILLSGWLLRLVGGQSILGGSLIVMGLGLIGGTIWWLGRQVKRTVYRPTPWTGRDWLIAGSVTLVGLAFLLPLPGLDRNSIFYYPYPTLTWPQIDPVISLITMGLLSPVGLTYFNRSESQSSL